MPNLDVGDILDKEYISEQEMHRDFTPTQQPPVFNSAWPFEGIMK